MKITTVNKNLIQNLSDRELFDLGQYFDQGATLLIGEGNQRQISRLQKLTRAPVLDFHSSELEILELEGIKTMTVSSLEQLDQLLALNPDGVLCVISDIIERKRELASFEMKWNNLDVYLRRTDQLTANTFHFITELQAGETYLHEGHTFHGVDLIRGDKYEIPSIEIGNNVTVQSLAFDRFGMQAINNLGRSRKRKLRQHGFETKQDLIGTKPEELLPIDDIGPQCACCFPAGARAIQNGEVVWYGANPLEGKNRIYIDIETDGLNPRIIWLIGAYIEAENSFHHIIEGEDPNRPEQVIREFIDWLTKLSNPTLVAWHGNQFDFRHLDAFIERYCSNEEIEAWKQVEKIDLLNDVIRKRVALPVRKFSLKHVAEKLGFSSNMSTLSGQDAARAATTWINNLDQKPDFDRWIDYCREDVLAMKHVYDRIQNEQKLFDKREIEQIYRRKA